MSPKLAYFDTDICWSYPTSHLILSYLVTHRDDCLVCKDHQHRRLRVFNFLSHMKYLQFNNSNAIWAPTWHSCNIFLYFIIPKIILHVLLFEGYLDMFSDSAFPGEYKRSTHNKYSFIAGHNSSKAHRLLVALYCVGQFLHETTKCICVCEPAW